METAWSGAMALALEFESRPQTAGQWSSASEMTSTGAVAHDCLPGLLTILVTISWHSPMFPRFDAVLTHRQTLSARAGSTAQNAGFGMTGRAIVRDATTRPSGFDSSRIKDKLMVWTGAAVVLLTETPGSLVGHGVSAVPACLLPLCSSTSTGVQR